MRITRRGSREANLRAIKRLLNEGLECWLYIDHRPMGLAYLTDGQRRHWFLCADAYEALVRSEKACFDRRGPWSGYIELVQPSAAA